MLKNVVLILSLTFSTIVNMFQVLALVWSGIFAAMIGSYIAFGISAAFHIFLISGVLVTVLVFCKDPKKDRAIKYNGRASSGEHY